MDPPISPATRVRTVALLIVLAVALGSIYLPGIGHGFVKDDFVWVSRSQIRTADDFGRMFRAPTGFFRPLVSASFAANRVLFGVHPLGYGLTNFALLIGCAGAVWVLARTLSLSGQAAAFGTFVWAFNFHGINAAVMWISGRTALLLTACAVLGAVDFVKGRHVRSSIWIFFAMLSKEEAVALPLILGLWFLRTGPRAVAVKGARSALLERAPSLMAAALALGCPLLGYLALRLRSGAFSPVSAPPYYQLSFSPGRLLANLAPYADRSLTFAAVMLVLVAAICRPKRLRLQDEEWSAVRFGVLWSAGGFALTMFLPVRSSLYVCFPAVGVAVTAAALAGAVWRESSSGRQATSLIVCALLPFALWPVYHARNRRSVSEAELSRSVLTQLAAIARSTPQTPLRIIVRDDRRARPSLDDAFGTLMQEAVDLIVGPQVRVWILPPPAGAPLAGVGPPPPPDVVLRLRDGAVEPVPILVPKS
jgi:hypothetical protein